MAVIALSLLALTLQLPALSNPLAVSCAARGAACSMLAGAPPARRRNIKQAEKVLYVDGNNLVSSARTRARSIPDFAGRFAPRRRRTLRCGRRTAASRTPSLPPASRRPREHSHPPAHSPSRTPVRPQPTLFTDSLQLFAPPHCTPLPAPLAISVPPPPPDRR